MCICSIINKYKCIIISINTIICIIYKAWWLIKLGTVILISNRSFNTQIFGIQWCLFQEQKQGPLLSLCLFYQQWLVKLITTMQIHNGHTFFLGASTFLEFSLKIFFGFRGWILSNMYNWNFPSFFKVHNWLWCYSFPSIETI